MWNKISFLTRRCNAAAFQEHWYLLMVVDGNWRKAGSTKCRIYKGQKDIIGCLTQLQSLYYPTDFALILSPGDTESTSIFCTNIIQWFCAKIIQSGQEAHKIF